MLGRAECSVSVLEKEAPFPAGDFDLVVVSPGIALTHPWLVEAKRRGLLIKSELQLGCEELKRRGWKLLAVTGSKGKSSVVKLIAEALKGVPCGNYGRPVCEVALSEGAPAGVRWAVVEVSSFMMETTALPPDTFEAAAILNLQEDHLDRHGCLAVYHGLKRKLLAMAKKSFSEAAPVTDLLKGSYFDNEILRMNGAIACGLLRAAGLADGAIATAFRTFEPLPHRMNLVAEIDGVRYVDDSKATSLAALAAGVRMCAGKVRLIAGGLPKGDDPKSVCELLTARVKKVYLIGQSAAAFAAAWSDSVECEICGTLERAVEAAKREAGKGETVLLSPGTASFDQFRNFEERGEVFSQLVK